LSYIFGKEKDVTKDVTIMEKNILVKTNKTRWKMVEMTRKFLVNGSYIKIKN